MHRDLGTTTLKDGTIGHLTLVTGPDVEWAGRIESLLGHKGPEWRWQNAQCLHADLGIEARYYLLLVADRPIANICTFERLGVGILGHVYTLPECRGNGAASQLMAAVMADAPKRGGRALILGTGFATQPYHIYRKFGFAGIEAGSGYMAWYAEDRERFESAYFGTDDLETAPLSWLDWPLAPVLFTAAVPGIVRNLQMQAVGRVSTESGMLPLLQARPGPQPSCLVLRRRSGAVMALAGWSWHPLWPGTCVVDLFSHPVSWGAAAELLQQLTLPAADRCVAYVDEQATAKAAALGPSFRPGPVLAARVARDAAKTGFAEVTVFEKQH